MKQTGDALPGTADQAATRNVSSVEIRDCDGRLLRIANRAQAAQLVAEGAARWSGYGRQAHVRLNVAMPPNSRRTWMGHAPAARGNIGATFRHNEASCRRWSASGPERGRG